VTLVASQDFDAAPGFVPPLHAAVFMVTGTHTYADESASEPLSVGIIRTSDNLSGTLHRSATIDFAHPAVVAGVTVAEADVLVPVPLGALTANPNVVDGVVARFTDTNLASTAGDFIASIDWGDGTTTTGTIDDVSGVITVSGTHSYAVCPRRDARRRRRQRQRHGERAGLCRRRTRPARHSRLLFYPAQSNAPR
jgi:hypothetical protein